MIGVLARASIDAALVVAVIWILTRTVRLSAAARTLLWWCAAAKFLVALVWTTPITIPILPAPPPAATVMAHDDPSSAEVRRGESIESAHISPASAVRRWSSFAAFAWGGGLLLLTLVTARRWRQTAVIAREAQPAPPALQGCAADLAARLALKRTPEVRISGRVETPLVAGIRRPVILLPAERFEALSDRQQEMAICHELTHVKRADLWLGCVPALTERLFFFHPLAHLVSREYALAREAACDAAVVETLDAAPREYGHLLLTLGVSRPEAGAAAGAARSFLHLKRRIAMLHELSSCSRRSRVVAAAAIALAVLALVPMRLVARPGASQWRIDEPIAVTPEHGTTTAERTEPIASQKGPAPERERSMTFVFLFDDHQTVSGSPEDLEAARKHQREGEPLFWFRHEGREYLVRDEALLRQVRAAVKRVNEHRRRELDGSDHVELLEKVAGSEWAVDTGLLGAKIGAQIGSMAAELVNEALRNLQHESFQVDKLKELETLKNFEHGKQLEGFEQFHNLEKFEHFKELEHLNKFEQFKELEHFKELEQLKEFEAKNFEHVKELAHLKELEQLDELQALKDRHLWAMEKESRELAHAAGEIHERMAREVEQSWKHDVEQSWKHDVERSDFNRHMSEVGREIGEHTRQAMEEIRRIIERALATGRAEIVR